MFQMNLPSVGALTTYVRLFDDKRQIGRLKITRDPGSSDGLNSWEEYQLQGEQLFSDAKRIISTLNSAPDADRIIRHLATFLEGSSSLPRADTLMPDDGASEDQTLADAIRGYLAKVDGGK